MKKIALLISSMCCLTACGRSQSSQVKDAGDSLSQSYHLIISLGGSLSDGKASAYLYEVGADKVETLVQRFDDCAPAPVAKDQSQCSDGGYSLTYDTARATSDSLLTAQLSTLQNPSNSYPFVCQLTTGDVSAIGLGQQLNCEPAIGPHPVAGVSNVVTPRAAAGSAPAQTATVGTTATSAQPTQTATVEATATSAEPMQTATVNATATSAQPTQTATVNASATSK